MDSLPSTILIRADGNARIGTGHVMRCLALAQGWQRTGGKAIFAMAEATPALEQRLQTEHLPIIRITANPGSTADAGATIKLAKQNTANWVVADGYHFGAEFQRAIQAAGLPLLLVDDYGHADHYSADLILNQNLSASTGLYRNRGTHTRLLLGTRHVLLRQQFLAYRNWPREIAPVARKLLVTLGGADPDNVTGKVIEAIRDLDVEAKIVVGGSNPHLDKLRFQVSGFSTRFSLIVDTQEMPALMAWADVAIAAGGTTSWELAFMGLPSLVLVLADNQRLVADALDQERVAIQTSIQTLAADLSTLLADAGQRSAMAARGRQLVDGEGVQRIAGQMRAANLSLRRVQSEDCELIWTWANDPAARAVSLSSEPIPWETHVQWFAARSQSPACLFYIATNGHRNPVGQIRYEINATEAVVSVNLAKEARGQGYGPALIVRGSEQCFAESAIERIRAYIKSSNVASISAFDRAGYRDAGETVVRNQTVRQFVLERRVAA